MTEYEQGKSHKNGTEGHSDGGRDTEEVKVEDAKDDRHGEKDDDDIGTLELGHKSAGFFGMGSMTDDLIDVGRVGGCVGGECCRRD